MKHTQRYTNRLLSRYRDQGLEAAVQYGCALFGGMPCYYRDIINTLPLPLRVGIERGRALAAEIKKAKAERAKIENSESAERDGQLKDEQEQEARKLLADLELARADGSEIRLLASLPPPVRDKLATRDEKKLVVALRKTGMMTAKACAYLGCSKTELNRGDADGRLLHLFTRVVMRERAVECRFWDVASLEAAREKLSIWWQQDVVRKKANRTGLRLVEKAA
jgi:hypothetical protein